MKQNQIVSPEGLEKLKSQVEGQLRHCREIIYDAKTTPGKYAEEYILAVSQVAKVRGTALQRLETQMATLNAE